MRITRNQQVTSKKLALARGLRQKMTPQEKILWAALRGDSLSGLHFRRQQIIAGYVVDFYCASAALAIEIDGDSHLGRSEYDSARDRALAELDIRTLRIRNERVDADVAAVMRMIAECATATVATPLSRRERGRG